MRGIRQCFMEEVTFEVDCEVRRKHFRRRKGKSIGSEAASMGSSDESVQLECGCDMGGSGAHKAGQLGIF